MAYFERGHFKMNYEIHPGLVACDTLFIHGNLASNSWWQPSLKIWRDRAENSRQTGAAPYQGRLIMAEWRGCGQSSAPHSEDELRMENLADDYLALLDHLQVSNANIVGHSAGGLIAMLCLAKGKFKRGVLLDPVGVRGVYFAPENVAAFQKMSEDREFCQLIMAATIKGVDQSTQLFQRIVDEAHNVPPILRTAIPHVLQLNTIDYSKQAKSISQPVWVMHGTEDLVLPLQSSREMAELLPEGKFSELPGHGHSYNMEDPRGFVERVTEFLQL